MDKDKHPYLFFGIYTVIIQAVMWALFSIYDYGFDEGHWADLGVSEPLLLLIAPVPIVSYIILNKKYFSDGRPILESLFQLICWSTVSIMMSAPVHLSISYGKWIVKQGGLNSMNGLEYVLVTIYEMILAALLLIKLIAEIIKTKGNKTTEVTT